MTRHARRAQRQISEERRRAAADREIGRQLAWFYYWEPTVKRTVPAVLLAAACWWVWVHVSHATIALVLTSIGVLALVAYGVWLARNGAHARVMAVARGQQINRSVWHLVAAGGALLIAGGIALLRVSL